MTPQFKIVAGRSFRPGLRQLIVGAAAQRIFHVKVGDTVILPDGEWPVVGVFSSQGGPLESGLLADTNTLMAATRRAAYGSVLVRLTGSGAFDSFSRWLTAHPSLQVVADHEAEFRLRSAGTYVDFFKSIAYFVASILAVGALFGSVNILYSIVSSRAREIATLRAVGYRAVPVAVAVVVEAMVLAFAGAVVGGMGTWLMFNGRDGLVVAEVYQQAVTADLIAIGIGWALVIAILGAIPPAIRAARLPVAQAMRAI
jgi:putative ABC transport system permease protein